MAKIKDSLPRKRHMSKGNKRFIIAVVLVAIIFIFLLFYDEKLSERNSPGKEPAIEKIISKN